MIKRLLTAIIMFGFVIASAREKHGNESTSGNDGERIMASAKVMDACGGAKSSMEMWVNNVRTIIFTGGDMWWDLFGSGNAFYVVPGTMDKSLGVSANFAGSIWIGGLDVGGQLKVAAMTYRQNGYDFWPGPLDPTSGTTNDGVCNKYDKIFKITRKEVEDHVYGVSTSDAVNKWPGNGIDGDRPMLAPFWDNNGDFFYDPSAGDYPYYDIYNKAEKDNLGVCKAKLFGDQTLWWVFNDKGNIHTETGGQSIGLEIRGQAFGFKTNDDINNMTFYNYEVVNRSTFTLFKTYFTVWTDADLGNYNDDYVGCDIDKGLGFIYNSDGNDQSIAGANGYGEFPAALGCDFFKGPLADEGDGIDNDYDTKIDEVGETIGMAKFLYYNNNIGSFPVQTTNPALASHYYNYMTGFWKDGSPFTDGGNAYGGSTPVNYVYPGELYPIVSGWNEFNAGNQAGDRRFLQSAGPFTLKPGAVNNVTFGLPWAQSPVKNDNLFAVGLLKNADLKAQALFDNCFKILDGPEAPDMTIQEGNNELMIYLNNNPYSNNYLNKYDERDVTIFPIPGQTAPCLASPDQNYRFEGYKVYQLRDGQVSQTDIDDATKAKLVFQCDVKNGVSRLINYLYDASIGSDVPKIKVEGSDDGIVTTFKVTEDAFSTSTNKKLINNKTYYFMAFAYAYNNYATYKPNGDPLANPCESYYGQKRPYLEGRKTKKAAGIPHLTDVESGGTISQSNYGYGPKIKRIEGQGNGGNSMDLTQATVNEILANGWARYPEYENGRGPIKVKVVDPLNIPNSTFTVKFLRLPSTAYNATSTPVPSAWAAPSPSVSHYAYGYKYLANASTTKYDSITWVLTNLADGKVYQPKKSIKVGEEYYFSDLGMSVNIEQVADPGGSVSSMTVNPVLYNAGDLIEASMTFADPTKQWLTGLADNDQADDQNWIRSGSKTDQSPNDYNDYFNTDPDKVFAKVLGGTWAPYSLVSTITKSSSSGQIVVQAAPGYNGSYYLSTYDDNKPAKTDPRFISSVDVIFTPDRSKWTRCVVLEMQADSLLAENVTRHFAIRDHASVDKNGNVGDGLVTNNPDDADYIGARGFGWFPGYAINIETGERLNMAFGEDSYNYADNGNDMIWNPTATINGSTYDDAWGGRHFIYVFGHNKDAKYSPNFTSTYLGISTLTNTPIGAGRYDGGLQIYNQIKATTSNTIASGSGAIPYKYPLQNITRDAMWVNIPLLKNSSYEFKNPSNMPCEVKVRIRVKKPYRYGYSTSWSDRIPVTSNNYVAGTNNFVCPVGPGNLPKDTAGIISVGGGTVNIMQNNNFPMYEFNTADIYTMFAESEVAKNALDYIRVVPNPYYGSSKYETKRIENKVRITNLPGACTIKIFTMNGTLIRTFKRDVTGQEDELVVTDGFSQSKRTPYLEWDLKNQYGVPIASGLYIIHIDAPGIGEKILKWFGVMRPLDLQSY